MTYLFDTNILVHYIRKTSVKTFVERTFNPANPRNRSVLSAVSVGEIRSIALQNQWAAKRLTELDELLAEFIITDINTDDLIRAYAKIDAFSQGNLPGKPLGATARNMGKNDLWIAASAHVLGASLLTTDKDFAHLHSVFVDLVEVPQH